jgi:hypothetical protein
MLRQTGIAWNVFCRRQLRSEERLAAIARGMDVPMQAELSEAARSLRAGVVTAARGFSEPSHRSFALFQNLISNSPLCESSNCCGCAFF